MASVTARVDPGCIVTVGQSGRLTGVPGSASNRYGFAQLEMLRLFSASVVSLCIISSSGTPARSSNRIWPPAARQRVHERGSAAAGVPLGAAGRRAALQTAWRVLTSAPHHGAPIVVERQGGGRGCHDSWRQHNILRQLQDYHFRGVAWMEGAGQGLWVLLAALSFNRRSRGGPS